MARRRKHGFTVNAELPSAYEMARELGVDKEGDVQGMATDLIMQNLPDFMPRDTGNLVGGMSKVNNWRIRVKGPYARFLFFGVKADGGPVDYSKQKNPQGGPHWDRRMYAARGRAITAELKRYVKRRKKRK